jgi:hypothetical protein
MQIVKEKTKILESWSFESPSDNGPSLSDYLESTKNGTFGDFEIILGDREKFANDAQEHIKRLLNALAKRFAPSVGQENLSILFDPQYLIQHKNNLNSNEYGRFALDYLRKKYKNFPGFDYTVVRNEWDSLKPALSDFINTLSNSFLVKEFWKNFVLLKTTTNNLFPDQHKNILILLNIYLISPTNSVECERGVC